MSRATQLVLAVLAVALLAGCRGWTTDDAPIVPIRNMYDQPRFDVQSKSDYFADGRTMRPIMEGTVSREMERSLSVATGRTEDGTGWLPLVPQPVVARAGGADKFVLRGQNRFNIYCAPCHSVAGDGLGMVPRRAQDLAMGYTVTSLHDKRLRETPDGQIFATITNGIGRMPPYGASMTGDDRWAIVSYVRALQLAGKESSK